MASEGLIKAKAVGSLIVFHKPMVSSPFSRHGIRQARLRLECHWQSIGTLVPMSIFVWIAIQAEPRLAQRISGLRKGCRDSPKNCSQKQPRASRYWNSLEGMRFKRRDAACCARFGGESRRSPIFPTAKAHAAHLRVRIEPSPSQKAGGEQSRRWLDPNHRSHRQQIPAGATSRETATTRE